MAEQEDERSALWRDCQQVVAWLAAQRRWQLLGQQDWASRACAGLQAGVASSIPRAAVHAYVEALYQACSGAEGAYRQNAGYRELFEYLFDIARRRYAEIAEEVAQIAVEQTFARFERCRVPGAFLAFAAQQLLAAARTVRQQQGGRQSGAPDQGLDDPDSLPDQHQSDLDASLIVAELHERFELLSRDFLARHPRAARQFAALRMKHIDGLDDAAIGRALDVSVDGVYVLRARAVEKLREESAWRALAAEFGILAGEV